METQNLRGQVHFNLPIGCIINNEYVREVELLKTNGVAEEVFTKKLSEKPYTWIGNVISIATARLGSTLIGSKVREEYVKTGSVNIPAPVLKLTLADANTMLLEIHRRVWQNLIPKQTIICKFCTKTLVADIDLNKVCMHPDNQAKLDAVGDAPFEYILTDLIDGFTIDEWAKEMKKTDEFGDLLGVNFNRIIMRIPTLGDAIRNEKLAVSDNIKFWRKIAFDCIVKIQSIEIRDGKEVVISEFPEDKIIFLGNRLFSTMLSAEDLRKLRDAVREEVPTMPFHYEDTCPCEMQKEIPFAMEASAFFSA
jgi:hypothetical protein